MVDISKWKCGNFVVFCVRKFRKFYWGMNVMNLVCVGSLEKFVIVILCFLILVWS